MPVTLPDDVAEGVDLVMRTFDAMAKAAQYQAKKQPTHDGLYPITLMMNAVVHRLADVQDWFARRGNGTRLNACHAMA
jgi:hypothetical protein